MKTPAFWSSRIDLRALLLWPLGWIYGRITAWRMGRPGQRADVPVICIGNLTAGGTGKTPTVRWLAQELKALGEKPFVVSRGYGGKLSGPAQVDACTMTAADCGDEPLLLARATPVIVARDRTAGAALAKSLGASLVILDDGLQNPGLAKDFSVAVVDAEAGFGNGFCVPAGPLRAPVERQLPKVDAFLAMGAAPEKGVPTLLSGFGRPVASGCLRADQDVIQSLAGKPLLAFAGIGRPERFFATLATAGHDVRETVAFADHHAFTRDEIAGLEKRAREGGFTLVTTEKDATRLQGMETPPVVLPVSLALNDDGLLAMIKEAIARRRSVT